MASALREMANGPNASRNSMGWVSEHAHEGHETSDLFSRTISEVEALLNEAITIARQATGVPSTPARIPSDISLHVYQPAPRRLSSSSRPTAETGLLPLPAKRASPKVSNATAYTGPQSYDFGLIPDAKTRTSNAADEISDPPAALPNAATPLRTHAEYLARRSPSSRNFRDARKHVMIHDQPPVMPRSSSTKLNPVSDRGPNSQLWIRRTEKSTAPSPARIETLVEEDTQQKLDPEGLEPQPLALFSPKLRTERADEVAKPHTRWLDLRNRRHVDIDATEDVEAHYSHNHQPIARDWCTSRKRWTATVTCINTALLGLIIGIYAGEVPALQYVLADFHHYMITGNVWFYLGLALPTLFLWPLPLLHGRKPYTILALSVALPLQIPQGLVAGNYRSPDVVTYRVLLLLCRALTGFALGFAAINFKATLLDLFGASLQSGNPHQEVLSSYDIRRHGGGMGVWLGIWAWCSIGSIGFGFLIGALLISKGNVTWGFWLSLFFIAFALLINIIAPEVRRSAYRRTVSEVVRGEGKWKRVARGEIKMHLVARGPLWWGEEVKWGWELSKRMMYQPGFLVLSLYIGWVYAQFTLIMMLLSALVSKYYRFTPGKVGICVCALSFGALVAMPFQKASLLSSARHHSARTDSMTMEKRSVCSSHLTRRIVFMACLPPAALACALTSAGPPMHPAAPSCMAALVGFLSSLAVAECNGLIMETFDTSDLQGGRTGRKQSHVPEKYRAQRTDFTCYPRVSAGFAMAQGVSYLLAAAATGCGGAVERRLGAEGAAAGVAIILTVFTILLTLVLLRLRTVRMIPDQLPPLVDQSGRRTTEWEPVIIGSPSGTMRRVSILELGSLCRWTEIRRRNRLLQGLSQMNEGQEAQATA